MAQVIFLQNIKGVAQIGDIKNVSDGYARNFLLPRKMARLSTPSALREAEILRKKREFLLVQEKEDSKVLAEKLSSYALKIEKLTNEEGTLFDSVDAAEISQHLKKQGFKIEPESIKLEKPIKTAGEYDITADLGYNIKAVLKINIVKKNENVE